MNYIIEQSIKRKNKVFITAMIMLFKILTAVLVVAALLIPSMFFIHLIVVAALTYYFSINANIEYEYSLKDELLTFNIIKNREKRKELLSLKIKDLVVIAPSKTEPLKEYIGKSMKTMDLTSHNDNVKYYCMIVKVNIKEVKILFEPSYEMLTKMKMLSPEKVFIN